MVTINVKSRTTLRPPQLLLVTHSSKCSCSHVRRTCILATLMQRSYNVCVCVYAAGRPRMAHHRDLPSAHWSLWLIQSLSRFVWSWGSFFLKGQIDTAYPHRRDLKHELSEALFWPEKGLWNGTDITDLWPRYCWQMKMMFCSCWCLDSRLGLLSVPEYWLNTVRFSKTFQRYLFIIHAT